MNKKMKISILILILLGITILVRISLSKENDYKLGEVITTDDYYMMFEYFEILQDDDGKDNIIIETYVEPRIKDYYFIGEIKGVSKKGKKIDPIIPKTQIDLGTSINNIQDKKLEIGKRENGYIAFNEDISEIILKDNDKNIKIKLVPRN